MSPVIHSLQRSHLQNGQLVFQEQDGFEAALKDGFFLVRIPDDIDVSVGDQFAQNFYKPKLGNHDPCEIYRGYMNFGPETFSDPLLGFHQRKYQIEQFLLERRFWVQYYTPALANLGERLCEVSADIIKSVLCKVGIPEEFWSKGTGGCASGEGSYHFTFNHFRPQMETLGLQAHQDDGFITILRSIDPGLEIFKDGGWVQLDAEPKYFKINFGLTMQILTEHAKTPVSAVMHRVVQQRQRSGQPDRWSWGHFSSCHFDKDFDHGIYAYNIKDGLKFCSGARDHINRNDSEIYK